MAYLRNHIEPNDESELKRMKQRVAGYTIIGDQLYKKKKRVCTTAQVHPTTGRRTTAQ